MRELATKLPVTKRLSAPAANDVRDAPCGRRSICTLLNPAREVELVAKLIVGQTGNGVGGPRLALTMNAQKPDVGTLWRVECVAQSHTTDRRARCAVPQEKAAELMLVPTALSERLR